MLRWVKCCGEFWFFCLFVICFGGKGWEKCCVSVVSFGWLVFFFTVVFHWEKRLKKSRGGEKSKACGLGMLLGL